MNARQPSRARTQPVRSFSPVPDELPLIVVRDRFGRIVRITDERVEHIREHREIRGFEAATTEALRAPDLVVESVSDPWVWLYHRVVTHPTLGEKLLCVAVKGGWRDAFVLTAYLTSRFKRGRRIWPPDA